MPTSITGAEGVDKVQAGSITPDDFAGSVPTRVVGAQITVTGAIVELATDLPDWVSQVELSFSGLSSNGTSEHLVQIGPAAGIVATGYFCQSGGFDAANQVLVNGTTGIIVKNPGAANSSAGVLRLTRQGTLLWLATVQLTHVGAGLGSQWFCVGSISLAGALKRIRLTNANGTDQFDAGTVSMNYA